MKTRLKKKTWTYKKIWTYYSGYDLASLATD